MKKNISTCDKSAPYRTLGIGKITAPTKQKDEPKSSRISTALGDLRGKRA